MKWTTEQQRAITTKGNNILVAAAAGSGKTAVLVERIIQKIIDEQEQLNIDELLVATFTNAAAEEMRQRIGLALEQALKNNPTSYHIKKQLSLLQRATISTLHSFCMNVVRQYSYVLDIDPAFRIADETEIDLLKHEVLDGLFEEWYGAKDEQLTQFFNVVDMFSSDRSDMNVAELILDIHTFAKQHPWPQKWLHDVANMYAVDEHTDETELTWLTLLKVEIKEQLDSFLELTEQALTIAHESDGPYHYIPALKADKQLFQDALSLLN